MQGLQYPAVRSNPARGARPEPLRGVRVLDFTSVLAGPYCTYQLALLGADVVKVERPDGGDWSRSGPRTGIADLSAGFVAQNADKQSVVIDLRAPDGRAMALALAATCDVVVENFAPGVAARLGIGCEQVKARKADVVYCSISGYGQDGEMSPRPAYDHVVQAASGVTMLTGTPDTVPNRIGPPMIDYIAGLYGSFAVLAALRERDRTGLAQHVDVAMLDAALAAMASTVSGVANSGETPRANGNRAASGSPLSGIFPTADGLLSMTANNDRQCIGIFRTLDWNEALSDPRFATRAARDENVGALQSELIQRLSTRTARDWENRFSAAHVPAARVRTVPEVLAEPHILARGVLQPVTDAKTGVALQLASIGFKWNGAPLGPRRVPPRLGEHTQAVLSALRTPSATGEAELAGPVAKSLSPATQERSS